MCRLNESAEYAVSSLQSLTKLFGYFEVSIQLVGDQHTEMLSH